MTKKQVPEHSILVPADATRVFSGIMFEVYQWPQKMYDGTTKTFEMAKTFDYVQIVAVKDGKIGIIRDEQPYRGMHVHFPGGRADHHGEALIDAAKREMREETGLSFKNWRMVAVYQPSPIAEQFAVWFLATEFESEQPQELDGGEKIALEWKTFEEVYAMIFGSDSPTMSYAMQMFSHVKSLEELLNMPEFTGKEIQA